MPAPSTPGRVPIRRALVSVYDKTGLEELARGLHDAGVELVSTGGSAALIEGLGAAGDPGRGPHRLPRVPRRPGQDPAPPGARRHPGRPPSRLPRRAARRPGRRAVRPRGVQPLPLHETVASGATPDECVEQIDIGGPSMVRAAAKNHPSVAIVTSPDRYGDALRGGVATGASPSRSGKRAGRRGVRPHRGVRRGRGELDGQRATSSADGRLAGLRRRDLEQVRGAALRREPAPAGRALRRRPAAVLAGGGAAARQGDVLQQLRRHRRGAAGRRTSMSTPPTVAIIKHANPCGIAVGADVAEAHRKAHECDPVSRLRRRDRGQPAGVGGDGRAGGRGVHRGDRRAGVRRRRRRGAARARRTSGSCVAPTAGGAPAEIRQISGGVLVQMPDHVDAARRRPRRLDARGG